MASHVKIVGVLHILVSGFHILLGLVWLAFLAAIKEFFELPPETTTMFAVILGIVPLLMVITSIPGFIAGLGLLNGAPWSRILAIIVGVLQLPNLPFGTGLGVYTIVVLLDEDAKRSFDPGYRADDSGLAGPQG